MIPTTVLVLFMPKVLVNSNRREKGATAGPTVEKKFLLRLPSQSATKEQTEASVVLGAFVCHNCCRRGVSVNRSPRVDPVAEWAGPS